MANEALVSKVKSIVAAVRAGNRDEAYAGYQALFASPAFVGYEPSDQRQALKLMVHAKGVPTPLAATIVEAHRAAIAPLTRLVTAHKDPADYEMLGMCHEAVGDTESAAKAYREGLTIERATNAQSDLCGALMRRISLI